MSRNVELLTPLKIDMTQRSSSEEESVDRFSTRDVKAAEPAYHCEREIAHLVQNIFHSSRGLALRSVAFCDVESECGSSAVCASVARYLAGNLTKSVCLVDANVRSSRLTMAVGAGIAVAINAKGLPSREQCSKIDENLWFAGSELFRDSLGAFIGKDELELRILQLQTGFDYLLIDAPAATVGTDASILGPLADAVVLVIEANCTRKQSALKAKQILEDAGVTLLGTVLNNGRFAIPDAIYRRL